MIIRSIGIILALLACVILEDSFISALPPPLYWIAPTFVIGVLIYHFVRPNFGCVWLAVGGAFLDLIGLSRVPHVVTFTLAGLVGIFLARKVFTNRSLYATMGLGVSMMTVQVILEDIALPFSDAASVFWTRMWVFALSLFLAFFVSRRLTALFQKLFLLRT